MERNVGNECCIHLNGTANETARAKAVLAVETGDAS